MFSEYASEITDPENRRRYEEEITALERERGVEVRFVHPEPGHVLRTSLDGEHRCFVNVCSNSLVSAPSSRPGPGSGGTATGSHWSLPYSLAPGRKYAGRSGSRYTVYDVVFHPEALALARSHERFREMLDTTALEAVEQQFGVKLDRRNAKTLKIKYKGVPEAAVLRTPLPGGVPAQPEGEPPGILPDLLYPGEHGSHTGASGSPGRAAAGAHGAALHRGAAPPRGPAGLPLLARRRPEPRAARAGGHHRAASAALGREGGAGGEGEAAVPGLPKPGLPPAGLAALPGGRRPRQGAVQQGAAAVGRHAARGATHRAPGPRHDAGRVRGGDRN
ncbi:Protein kintoun [Lemmus lemmus]